MIKTVVQYIALILLNEKKWMIQLKIKYIEFQKRIDSMSFESKQKIFLQRNTLQITLSNKTLSSFCKKIIWH